MQLQFKKEYWSSSCSAFYISHFRRHLTIHRGILKSGIPGLSRSRRWHFTSIPWSKLQVMRGNKLVQLTVNKTEHRNGNWIEGEGALHDSRNTTDCRLHTWRQTTCNINSTYNILQKFRGFDLVFIANICSRAVYNKVLAEQVFVDFSVSRRVLASPLAPPPCFNKIKVKCH